MLRIGSIAVAKMAAVGLACTLWATATAQDATTPQLESQLNTVYKVTQVTNGNVTSVGTLVKLTRPNLLWPTRQGQFILCPATVKQDKEQQPNYLCRKMTAGGNFLQAGQMLYITKLKVNQAKDTVSLELVEAVADPQTGNAAAPGFKTELNFAFAGGYLAKADAGQVADVINTVLTPDTGGDAGSQATVQQTTQPSAPAQTYAPQPTSQPGQVELGMTEEQVKGILGQPTTAKQAGAATKVYVYRKTITFQGGKVSSIE